MTMDFLARWNGIKNEMFNAVEDPMKSKWWDKAWEIMLDPQSGPLVDTKMPDVEVALLLVELRNIYTGYEFMYWDHDYDPLWLDYWNATGLPWRQLVLYLIGKGLLEDVSPDTLKDDSAVAVISAVHTYCWGKRQMIFDAMLAHFEDEMSMGMFMLGGNIPRNKDAAHRIIGYVDNQFEF